jgi:hypothetical protein
MKDKDAQLMMEALQKSHEDKEITTEGVGTAAAMVGLGAVGGALAGKFYDRLEKKWKRKKVSKESDDYHVEQGPVADVGRGLDEIVQNIKNFFNNGQVDIPNTGNWVELTDDPGINLAGELEVIMIGIVKGAHVEPPFEPDKWSDADFIKWRDDPRWGKPGGPGSPPPGN